LLETSGAEVQRGASRAERDEVTREEVRPGLTMIKRRTRKEDGRYLIYYEFERAGEPSDPAPEPGR
jgi:hypothetical protein